MKNVVSFVIALAVLLAGVAAASAQVSPARLKVTRQSKSDSKETYRSSDGRYRSGEKTKTVLYKVEVSNVSGGPAKEFVIKWAVLVKSDDAVYTYQDGNMKRQNLRVVEGEKTCKLEFGKSFNFETDVIELTGWESVSSGMYRSESGAKVIGYAVEVFCNGERVASDIQPADTKKKIDQTKGEGEQKRHQF